MQTIPLKPVPLQTVTATLNGQAVQIDVRQRRTGLFADLYVSNKILVAGVICQDRNVWVRSAYLGFSGDLAFVDMQGTSDPTVDGLGTRFRLCYFAPGETPFDPIVSEG